MRLSCLSTLSQVRTLQRNKTQPHTQTTEREIENTFKLSSSPFQVLAFHLGLDRATAPLGLFEPPVHESMAGKQYQLWQKPIPAMAQIHLAGIELATFSVYMIEHGKTRVEVERGGGEGRGRGQGERYIETSISFLSQTATMANSCFPVSSF